MTTSEIIPPVSSPAAPRAVPRALPPPPAQRAGAAVRFTAPPVSAGHRIVLYGSGGIGKTTLAAQLPGAVFIDLDESLGRLRLPSAPQVVAGIDKWQTLRDVLRTPGWDGVGSIVIDTGTRAEELAAEHTLATVMKERGTRATSLEDYGYGKGLAHLFDVFLPLLADLDTHSRAGRHVCIICHDCTTNVPNPAGEDYLRYEPRLSSPKSGKDSIRLRSREWADHVMFVGADVAAEDGKGKGAGTRAVYSLEAPHCMAKSRTAPGIYPLTRDAAGRVLSGGVPLWDIFLNPTAK